MNIEVDNEILASVIDTRFSIKPQLSSNIEKANFKQTIFFPEDKLKSNTLNSVPLDTYGIINKSKLFTREPITGEQISYFINDNGYTVKDNNPDIKIETTDYKIFYRFEINEIQHKYCSSIFTNLKFKKINIVFPNTSLKLDFVLGSAEKDPDMCIYFLYTSWISFIMDCKYF